MLVLFVEDRPNAVHCREKSRHSLAVTLPVVELRQINRVLVGVGKPAAIEIVLQVALD